MKKLKLQVQEFKGAELLSREQLKTIVGGMQVKDTGSCPDGQFWCTCNGSEGSGCCASTMQECWDAC